METTTKCDINLYSKYGNTIGNIKEKAFNYYVELGDREFKNNNYQKAKEFYEKALSFKNKEIENLTKINKIIPLREEGLELFNDGYYENALTKFEEILKIKPDDLEAKEMIDKINKIKQLILEVDEFFEERIEKAKSFGIKDKDIILDVGIGFGKSLKHNLLLIKHLGHFKKFGYELLIGASRKSMINMIVKSPVEQRLPGTLSIHLKAVQNGASIIRCHDVKEHFQAISVFEKLREFDL